MRSMTDNRSHSRSNVFLSAILVAGTTSLPVLVRNLSQRGAFLDGGPFTPVGAKVELVRGNLSVRAEIIWQADGHAGLRFAGEIDVGEWVKRVGHPGQQRSTMRWLHCAAISRRRPARVPKRSRSVVSAPSLTAFASGSPPRPQ